MNHNIFDQVDRKIERKDNVFGNFLVEKGLYEDIEITKENIFELADLVGGHVRINAYCTECKESRVFCSEAIKMYLDMGDIQAYSLEEQIVSIQRKFDRPIPRFADEPEPVWQWNSAFIEDAMRVLVFPFRCAMDECHRLDYIALIQGNRMKKIGQYPTVADLTLPELKDYQKVVSEEDLKELKRAIGLHASGIGIGAFVYLRRIFERIIAATGKIAIEEGVISEEQFKQAHMDERIKMLSKYLPKSMNNTEFYKIVSKGIHQLSEDDCIEYFPVMKSYIMMVYREWEKQRKDLEEEKSISASISRIASGLSKDT